MSDLYPMLVQPRFVERIWGGSGLATRLGKPAPGDRPIGESWEIYEENPVINGPYAGKTIGELRTLMGADMMGHVPSGELFPLLTKLIDAMDVLSVQVHPDNHFADVLEHQPYGKTECWYIIDATPDAALTYGFAHDSTPDEYEELVRSGRLDQALRTLPVHAGDVVYIPAGTVHAIGAGIILYELQQTSDVTYRIYDWNRHDAQGKSRELHVEKARQVLDYHQATRGTIRPLHRPGNARSTLIASQYFCMELVDTDRTEDLSTHESPVAICALEHPAVIRAGRAGDAVRLPPYSSLLVPAAAGTYTLEPDDGGGDRTRALVAYVPLSVQATAEDLRDQGFSDGEIQPFLAQFAPAVELGQPAVAAESR